MVKKLLPKVNEVVKGLNGILSDGFQKEDIGAIGELITTTILDAVKGLAGAMPQIVDTVVATINELVNVLMEILPQVLPALIDGAMQLLDGLVQAISDNADQLGDMVAYLIIAIVNFITKKFTKIVSCRN